MDKVETVEYAYSKQISNLHDEVFIMRTELMRLKAYLERQFQEMDLKKIKRNRTVRNRCQYPKKQSGSCHGYVCKKSSTLCYAHYIQCNSPYTHSRLFGKNAPEETLVDIELPDLDVPDLDAIDYSGTIFKK